MCRVNKSIGSQQSSLNAALAAACAWFLGGKRVFRFDYDENVAVVDDPLNCMVGCSTCATICPREAIEFPSRGYLQQLIRDEKVLRKTKDQLRDNPEQYGV